MSTPDFLDMGKQSPLGRIGQPDEIAATIRGPAC